MDNQHRQIKGYRELTQTEIQMMNEVKTLGEQIGALLESLRNVPDVDQRWLAIGQTHLQQGLMAATRAIARPTTF